MLLPVILSLVINTPRPRPPLNVVYSQQEHTNSSEALRLSVLLRLPVSFFVLHVMSELCFLSQSCLWLAVIYGPVERNELRKVDKSCKDDKER